MNASPGRARVRGSALLVLVVLGPWLSARSQSDSDHNSSAALLAARIQSGDGVAILEAGSSGNASYVPQLLGLRHKPGKNVSLAEVQLALAKLGQREELQEILCEARFGSASVQYDAITDKLKYVGGWFSIETVSSVLIIPTIAFFRRTLQVHLHRWDGTRSKCYLWSFRIRRRFPLEIWCQVHPGT